MLKQNKQLISVTNPSYMEFMPGSVAETDPTHTTNNGRDKGQAQGTRHNIWAWENEESQTWPLASVHKRQPSLFHIRKKRSKVPRKGDWGSIRRVPRKTFCARVTPRKWGLQGKFCIQLSLFWASTLEETGSFRYWVLSLVWISTARWRNPLTRNTL